MAATTRPSLRRILLLGVFLLVPCEARALLLAGFETGLDGFTTAGDVYRVDGSFSPGIVGGFALYLSTFPNTGGVGDLTGDPIESPRPDPAVSASVLEAFLGLAPNALDAPLSPSGNPATQGSAAQITFTVTVDTTVRLRFNMLTNETTVWSPTWRDYVFSTLTGLGPQVEADVDASPLVASPTVFNRETGWGMIEYAGLAPGTYTLGIGVVDVQDGNVGTAVLIDQVRLIPEAELLVLLGSAGLGGIWVAGRRRP